MAEQAISQGAIEAIFSDPNVQTRFPVPVLQCLQLKELDSKGGDSNTAQRFRIVLSDVRNYVQCMLATQANHVVHDGKLVRGSIVRMKQYQAQVVKGKNVLIVLELEVIEELGSPDKIGEPKALDVSARSEPQNTIIGGAGFYGVKNEPTQDSKSQVQKQQQLLPTRPNNSNSGSNGASNVSPIDMLSPYTHKWTIKARVTSKSDIRTWHKPTGEGKLFSVNLLDESGEIKATGFNDQCDQFYALLQEGSVYYISSPARVQLAKKQFTNLPNDYEITLERDTQIEKCEDQGAVPQIRFNFCSIQDLANVEKDATVDVVGVLKEVQEVSSIQSKTTGKDYEKRELTLVDDTGYSVRVTIWGKLAVGFDAKPESVVALKGTRVGDFGGRSLSLLSSGSMAVDPDIPEAHRLKGWYDASGHGDTFASHSNMAALGAATGRKDQAKHVAQVKEEQLGMGEAPDYFQLTATIVYIRHESNWCYPACRTADCNKKVTDTGDGSWRCERCDKNWDRPEYRYIMSVSAADHTGQLWLSCFDDTGRVVMGGKSADELMELAEQDDALKAAEFDNASCRKYTFRCRAKMDNYGEQTRVRYQVMSATPLNYTAEANRLTELIKQMSV